MNKNALGRWRTLNLAGIKPLYACLILLAAVLTSGCAESYWQIPCKSGEPQSKMWSSDPRTKSWPDVVVTYALMGNGTVDADVHSSDGRQRFHQQGVISYEDADGRPPKDYYSRQFMVMNFGGQIERYVFSSEQGVNSGCITLAP